MTLPAEQVINEIQIGAEVYLRMSSDVWTICDIQEDSSGAMILSTGMTPITKKITCVSSDCELKREVTEHDIVDFRDASPASLDKCEEMLQKFEEIQINRFLKRERERKEQEEFANRFYEEITPKVPKWAKAVIIARHVKDQSDIMTDYHGSTTTSNIVLAFSKHTRDLFPEMRKAAANHPSVTYLADAPESAEHREKYSMGHGYYLKDGYRHATGWEICKVPLVYRGSEQNIRSIPVGEWAVPEGTPTTVSKSSLKAANDSPACAHIEQHVHTKHGFDMYMVVLDDQVERDQFNEYRNFCKKMGGWYSRKWGTTPGGFAFKEESDAQSFLSWVTGEREPSPAPVKPKANIADKLRTLADGMQSKIDDKLSDRLTNTPKRLAQARHAQMEGQWMQRTQAALRVLAGMHESAKVPPELANYTTKAAVHELMRSKTEHVSNGFHDYRVETGEPSSDSVGAALLWSLINTSPMNEAEKEIQRLQDDLQFSKILGYFPTPTAVAQELVMEAGISGGDLVLEPSIGSAAIAEQAKDYGATVKGYEINHSLYKLSTLKGFDVECEDFMSVEPEEIYDAVVMNPPFEKGQDMEHVRHAFKFLKPGKILTAIMSPAFQFHQSKKAQQFRDWLRELNWAEKELPEGTFKESGTGVNTVMLVIQKDES